MHNKKKTDLIIHDGHFHIAIDFVEPFNCNLALNCAARYSERNHKARMLWP